MLASRKSWPCPMCPKSWDNPFNDPRDLMKHLDEECGLLGQKMLRCFRCAPVEDEAKPSKGNGSCCRRPSLRRLLGKFLMPRRPSVRSKSTSSFSSDSSGRISDPLQCQPQPSYCQDWATEYDAQPSLQTARDHRENPTLEPITSLDELHHISASRSTDCKTTAGHGSPLDAPRSWHEAQSAGPYNRPSPSMTPLNFDGQFSPTTASKPEATAASGSTLLPTVSPVTTMMANQWPPPQYFHRTQVEYSPVSPVDEGFPPVYSEAPDTPVRLELSADPTLQSIPTYRHGDSVFEADSGHISSSSVSSSYSSLPSPLALHLPPATPSSSRFATTMGEVSDPANHHRGHFRRTPVELPVTVSAGSPHGGQPPSSLPPDFTRALSLPSRPQPAGDECIPSPGLRDSRPSFTAADCVPSPEHFRCDVGRCNWMPRPTGKPENFARYLRKHKRTHLDESHACDKCKRHYSRRDNLGNHRKSHGSKVDTANPMPRVPSPSPMSDEYGSLPDTRPSQKKRKRPRHE